MLDRAAKRVGPLEFWDAGDVNGMRAGAEGHRVEYGVRDRVRLLGAGGDAKLIIVGAALNSHDLGLELDMRQQPELRGKVVQVGGIFLPSPEAALLAQWGRVAGEGHVVLRHR